MHDASSLVEPVARIKEMQRVIVCIVVMREATPIPDQPYIECWASLFYGTEQNRMEWFWDPISWNGISLHERP